MASSANRPAALLIFDGDCGFCRRSVRWVLQHAAERVEAIGSERYDFARAPDGVTAEACSRAVFLVEPRHGGGPPRVFRGAAALVRALSRGSALGWLWLVWSVVPGLAWIAEKVYGVVASHRVQTSRLIRRLGGEDPSPPQWRLGRSMLQVFVGLAFAAELFALWRDAPGLVGDDGVRPLRFLFPRDDLPVDWDDWIKQPTPLWFAPSYGALRGLLLVGAIGGLLAATGFLARWGLLLAWLALLGFVGLLQPPLGAQHGGNVFAGGPADALLLEVGFLSWLLVASGRLRARNKDLPAPLGMFLLRFTLARALLIEGLARWQSPSWDLDGALRLHWWNQVLPTNGALVAQGLAEPWVVAAGVLLWAGELAAPLLLVGPRRMRNIGVVLVILHELLRAWTGLHGSYPLVLIGLALAALDDPTWRWLFGWRSRLRSRWAEVQPLRRRRVPAALRGCFAVAFVVLAVAVSGEYLRALRQAPGERVNSVSGWFVCNGYAPAAAVRALSQESSPRPGQPPAFEGARFRPVLVIEARAADGRWHMLEPRFATGGPLALPPGPSTVQHRLDALWLDAARQVAFGRDVPPWFTTLLGRVLAGSADVMGLFQGWPADAGTPAALRVRAFGYRPASAEQRAAGQGWERRPLGLDGPVLQLVDGTLVPQPR